MSRARVINVGIGRGVLCAQDHASTLHSCGKTAGRKGARCVEPSRKTSKLSAGRTHFLFFFLMPPLELETAARGAIVVAGVGHAACWGQESGIANGWRA